MKIKWNRKYTTVAVYAFLVITACLLLGLAVSGYFNGFFAAVGSVFRALLPILYGFVLAYFVIPLVDFFHKILTKIFKKRGDSRLRRVVSIVIAYAVVLAVLTGLVLLILPQIIDSIRTLVSNFGEYSSQLQAFFDRFDAMTPTVSVELLEKLITKAYDTLNGYLGELADRATAFIPELYDLTVSVVTTIINLLLGFVVSIYIVADRRHFAEQGRRITQCLLPKRASSFVLDLVHRCDEVFSSFFIGKSLDSLIVALICLVGMYILRIPYPPLIALIVGITNMIPYFGPFIGTIPCALLILLIDPWKALWFVIFIIVLQQIDGNIIGPKIVGDSIGLSSFWVVFSLLLFAKLFGFVGMLLGSPIFAVIYGLVRDGVTHREQKLAEKAAASLPEEPADADTDTIEETSEE